MSRDRVRTAWVGGLVLALGATAWMLILNQRSDSEADAGAAALAAARSQVVDMLSYDHRTVDADLSAAQEHLTGDFKSEFGRLTAELIEPSAREKQITTTAEVTEAGVVRATRDEVKALLFVTQTTTSKGQKAPKIDGSRLEVTMKRVDGTWLMSALDPV